MYDIANRWGQPSPLVSSLKHVLPTITSTAFSELTIIYHDEGFPFTFCEQPHPHIRLHIDRKEWDPKNRTVFEMFREMRQIRNFKLVLCADVSGPIVEYAVRQLELAIETGWVGEGSDDILSRPVVRCSPHGCLPAPGDLWWTYSGFVERLRPWAPASRLSICGSGSGAARS